MLSGTYIPAGAAVFEAVLVSVAAVCLSSGCIVPVCIAVEAVATEVVVIHCPGARKACPSTNLHSRVIISLKNRLSSWDRVLSGTLVVRMGVLRPLGWVMLLQQTIGEVGEALATAVVIAPKGTSWWSCLAGSGK